MKKQKNANEFILTNPEKILYPKLGITKKNLAEYYEHVQDWILPYICNRPLTLVRCPKTYETCFYQKHLINMPASLYGIDIKEKHHTGEYIYLKDNQGLMALPQLGVLEIHPWGATIKNVEKPDMIIFDLDPAEGVAWKQVVKAAFAIKKQLAAVKLESFVKSTGGKGLHVVIPIKPYYEWEAIKNFAHVLVDFMVMQDPTAYIGKMTKVARKGKIFIDYLRNSRGATAIAPYSTRARAEASVATPIDWDELSSNFKDTYYTIKTLPKRLLHLRKDPWKDFFKVKQSLRLTNLK